MRFVAFLIVATAINGCGSEDPSDRSSISPGEPAGTQCAPLNLTQACSCGIGAPGRQTCKPGGYSACECAAPAAGPAGAAGSNAAIGGGAGAIPRSPRMVPSMTLAGDPPANHSSVRFDWARTVPVAGSCEAGHYEGTFTGWYSPAIIVVPDLPVIPVFPVELPGNPGLAFDLLREGNGEIFTVANGKMNGNALGAFPFSADVVGKLNCDTLKFEAMLVRGSYFIGPLEYRFEGPITADYDKLTHTMVNGVWEVKEPDAIGSGGAGDWTIAWIRGT